MYKIKTSQNLKIYYLKGKMQLKLKKVKKLKIANRLAISHFKSCEIQLLLMKKLWARQKLHETTSAVAWKASTQRQNLPQKREIGKALDFLHSSWNNDWKQFNFISQEQNKFLKGKFSQISIKLIIFKDQNVHNFSMYKIR